MERLRDRYKKGGHLKVSADVFREKGRGKVKKSKGGKALKLHAVVWKEGKLAQVQAQAQGKVVRQG